MSDGCGTGARRFITVEANGEVVVSGRLTTNDLVRLGLSLPLRVIRLADAHRRYLDFNRVPVSR